MWTYRLHRYFWNACAWGEDGVPEKLGEGITATKDATLEAMAEALAGVVRDQVLDIGC